jgi:RHS repeat-associated protein
MTFTYNTDVQLTTITDASNRETHLTYNEAGLVTQVADPFGRTSHFEYDTNRNLTKIIDMGGYWFAFTYDEDIYLTGLTTERGTTKFWIEPADGNATSSDNEYPPPGDPMWENYRITVTYPAGEQEEFYYNGKDSSWHVKPKDYIPWQGQEINNLRSTTPRTIYENWPVVEERGEIRKITFPDNSYTQYTFDHNTGDRTGINDNLNTTVAYSYNAMGRVTSMTNTHGKVTTYTYDAVNQVDLQTIQNDLGTATFTYDGHHQVTSVTDQLNQTTHYSYNSYGQLTSIEGADGVVTELIYNSDHFLQQVLRAGLTIAQYTHDPIGRIATRVDATGLMLECAYTNLDQLSSIRYPDGKQINYQYTGCCPWLIDSITDRGGSTIHYEYDARKFLTAVIRGNGSTIRNYYDFNGNLIEILDPNNNKTKFEYDANDRLTRKVYADNSSVSFEYDNVGRLSRRTDARGVITSYQYDGFHNLVGVTYSDGTPGVTYRYDDFDRLVGSTDATGSSVYAYEGRSRLKSIDGPWSGDKLTYQYDALNRMVGIQPETGQTLGLVYDPLGRLSYVQAGAAAFAYSFKSSASPLLDRLTRSNGSYTSYQYDSLNRLTTIQNKTAADGLITGNQFAYNAQDLIGSETVETNPALAGFNEGVTTYSHNSVNQLTNTTNPEQSFAYDVAGNMTSGLTPDGKVYTAAYDGENRLKSIQYTDSSQVVHKSEMMYNSDGFLSILKKYENSTLTDELRIIRSGLLSMQDRDGSNNIIREYTWGPGLGGIGGLLNMRQGGQDYNYLYDGKGNVLAVIDNAQNVVASYRYDSFGRLMVKSGTLSQPYQFSTKRYLDDVGLNYYGYRFYAPKIGRWMNRDPLGEAGGINLYGFVQNDPVNKIDPFGLSDLFYDSGSGTLTLYDSGGNVVGSWPASNNAASNSNGPWTSGTYDYLYHTPHPESGLNDSYGSNGNYVFDVPGRSGMGVHSGRANNCDKANRCGSAYATMGCIRTNDEATDLIGITNLYDPLMTITMK